MDVEIITIGDEVLTGHTVDTNAAFIAEMLTEMGLSVRWQSSVGDDIESMEETFRLALKRASVVITTGGLGPTDDDLTKRAIVKVFKRNLVFHEDILAEIKQRYEARGLQMPAINQNQALLPQGALFFANKHGSAVGICINEMGRIFVSLPGVPREMKQVLVDEVVPYLKANTQRISLAVRKLRTTQIIESALAELIVPGLSLEPGVRLAYLPGYSGVDLRIMAYGENDDETSNKARAVAQHIEKRAGKYIYGYDDDTLEDVIGHLLADNNKSLSVAESCTGGQLGMTITSVAGSSTYFVGGVQAYANEVKIHQLSVTPEIINTHGAVSEACAIAMAEGVRKLLRTDYALSVTGIAGPDGGTESRPVGTTFVGVATANRSYAGKFMYGRDRLVNRSRAVYSALELLRREILDIV